MSRIEVIGADPSDPQVREAVDIIAVAFKKAMLSTNADIYYLVRDAREECKKAIKNKDKNCIWIMNETFWKIGESILDRFEDSKFVKSDFYESLSAELREMFPKGDIIFSPENLAKQLRMENPPIFTRVHKESILFDFRTIQEGEDKYITDALLALLKKEKSNNV